jgi:hypothetical protein
MAPVSERSAWRCAFEMCTEECIDKRIGRTSRCAIEMCIKEHTEICMDECIGQCLFYAVFVLVGVYV